MGEFLRVNLTELDTCTTALSRLKSEFEHAADIARDARAAVGHPVMATALHDFSTNWKYHRQKLTENLESTRKMAEQAARAYRDTDRGLADSLTCPRPSSGSAR